MLKTGFFRRDFEGLMSGRGGSAGSPRPIDTFRQEHQFEEEEGLRHFVLWILNYRELYP